MLVWTDEDLNEADQPGRRKRKRLCAVVMRSQSSACLEPIQKREEILVVKVRRGEEREREHFVRGSKLVLNYEAAKAATAASRRSGAPKGGLLCCSLSCTRRCRTHVKVESPSMSSARGGAPGEEGDLSRRIFEASTHTERERVLQQQHWPSSISRDQRNTKST